VILGFRLSFISGDCKELSNIQDSIVTKVHYCGGGLCNGQVSARPSVSHQKANQLRTQQQMRVASC